VINYVATRSANDDGKAGPDDFSGFLLQVIRYLTTLPLLCCVLVRRRLLVGLTTTPNPET